MRLDAEGFPLGSAYEGDPIRQMRHPKLKVLEQTDREPLAIAFHVPEPDGQLLDKLNSLFARWEQTRKTTVGCGCSTTSLEYYGHFSKDDPLCCEFCCEWICERCLPHLLETIDQEIPYIHRVNVGNHQQENAPRKGPFWLDVPSRTITIQGVGSFEVPAFTISRYEVTVGEYHEFTKATRYVTDSERRGDVSFRAHAVVSSLPRNSLLECAATNISWNDAKAYCEWKGCHLPSTQEAISASIQYLEFWRDYTQAREEQLSTRRPHDPKIDQQFGQRQASSEMIQWQDTWVATEGFDKYDSFGFSTGKWNLLSSDEDGRHYQVQFGSPPCLIQWPKQPVDLDLQGSIMRGFVVIQSSQNNQ